MKKRAKPVVWKPPAKSPAGGSPRAETSEKSKRGSGVAAQQGKGGKVAKKKVVVWTPPPQMEQAEFAVFGRVQRVVKLPDDGTEKAALVREFYESDNRGVPVEEFKCGEPTCVGILVDGRVHHSWNCPWWNKPENKTKTPF